MFKAIHFVCLFALALLTPRVQGATTPGTASAPPRPEGLRVESLTDPVGLDTVQPRFSWIIPAGRRGLRQTACQVLVSTSTAALDQDRGELWDSGRLDTEQSHLLPYGGQPLASNQPCFWKVRFWDERGAPSPWSAPAHWMTGLLSPLSEWKAPWIGLDVPPDTAGPAGGDDPCGLAEASWITHPSADQPPLPTPFSFRKELPLHLAQVRRVTLAIHSDSPLTSSSQCFVNGRELLQFGWGVPKVMEITGWLREGKNILTFRNVPRLIGALRIEKTDGSEELVRSGADWQVCSGALDHWDAEAVHRARWEAPRVVAANGQIPMKEQGKVGTSLSLLPPAVRLRHEFTLRGPVRSAVLHATALGAYDVYLNGRRIGAGRFKPGWMQFDQRIALISDDVTSHLRPGANAIGAELAEGAFTGNVSWLGRNPALSPRFAAQLHVQYADGSQEVIASAPDWKGFAGPTRQADILMGERYDARLEQAGWAAPGFDDQAWRAVDVGSTVADYGTTKFADVTARLASRIKNNTLVVRVDNNLAGDPVPGSVKQLRIEYIMDSAAPRQVVVNEGQDLRIPSPGDKYGAPIKIVRALYGRFETGTRAPCTIAARACPPVLPGGEIRPVRLSEPRPGVYVFDFGRNLAGWTRLRVRGHAGSHVLVRHAETLRPDGTLDTNNLRSASAADEYILRGIGEESWEPRFTYHGFRYAQVLGLAERPAPDTLTAVEAGSAGPITSAFHSSSPELNRLYETICRTQRANMFDLPSNTPARDERMGYTGNFLAFLTTAQYNQRGLDTFAWKWLLDLLDRQIDDGSKQQGNVGKMAPAPYGLGVAEPAPLDWGIITILIPWNLYQFYGDLERAQRVYPALKRYMSFTEQVVRDLNDDYLEKDGGVGDQVDGDWLAPGAKPPRPVIVRACATLASDRMAELAEALGHPEDARRYREMAQSLRAGFTRKSLGADGTVEGDTLTGYALALRLGLIAGKGRAEATQRFLARLEKDGWRPCVGYDGVAHLLPALSAAGRSDLALRVLLSQGFPSWSDMLSGGATTIGEAWRYDGSSSLNRFALGSCGEWLFEDLLGIQPAAPGFRRVRVRPAAGCGLEFAEGAFESVYGRIAASWRIQQGRATLTLSVPPNVTAEVWIPAHTAGNASGAVAEIQESGTPLAEAVGVKVIEKKEDAMVVETGSGEYRFEWAW